MSDTIEEHRFPCEACGSDLRYLPGSPLLHCDHCGNEQEIAGAGEWRGAAIKELDFRRAVSQSLPEAEIEETRVLSCPSCGAQVEMSESSHAAECPFCATPVVTDTGTHRHLKPHGVLPFKMTEEEARRELVRWMGSLWFAPNSLLEYARKGRRMQGIYVPYWTYDADTKTRYRGQRGTVYHESKTVSAMVNGKRTTRQVNVQKIRWSPVQGRVARFFDDVLVLASRSLPKAYTDALEPWDLKDLEPYQPQFLAGFSAEGYQISLEDGYDEAREIMNARIARDVRFDIGGDRQRIDHLETDVGTLTFKHVLLPVWLAAYKFRGKSYRFVVNGRTGRVKGQRPWSLIKITIAATFAFTIAVVIGYLLAQNSAG